MRCGEDEEDSVSSLEELQYSEVGHTRARKGNDAEWTIEVEGKSSSQKEERTMLQEERMANSATCWCSVMEVTREKQLTERDNIQSYW